MNFDSDVGFQPPGEICSRDVTSPIDPSDHKGLELVLKSRTVDFHNLPKDLSPIVTAPSHSVTLLEGLSNL